MYQKSNCMSYKVQQLWFVVCKISIATVATNGYVMLQQSATAMLFEASVILLTVTKASRRTVSLSRKIIIDEAVLLDGANLYLPSFPFGSI